MKRSGNIMHRIATIRAKRLPMAVQSEFNFRLCSTSWLPQHDIPEINNRKMEGKGKVPENEKAKNVMSTQRPRGVKRPFSTGRTQVQTATPSTAPVTFENASPRHPGLQIIAVASGDGTSYIDSRAKNPEGIAKAMNDEILELKKEVARKNSGKY